ncbi:MAG: T9SS type A sorting domain-containing protein [bacterium]
MKHILVLFLLVICIANSYGQLWQENIKEPDNFYSIRQAYLQKLESDKKNAQLKSEESDGEEAKFRRWEYLIEPRVFPSGKLPGSGYLLEEWNKFKAKNTDFGDSLFDANWVTLESPEGFPDQGYSGRLNCIAFHPLDTNIFFVGAPAGGLWKTSDGGKSWVTKTDNLPSLGVSEIVMNSQNPNIMYMATGDRDGAYFISNPYSYGILKSTDGGDTWDTTGLNHIFAAQMTIQRLIIHPTNPNILLAAISGVNGTSRGIWRTNDGGKKWTNMTGGAKYDVEFNPADPNIVYASGWKALLRSTDCGLTWKGITSDVLPTTDISSSRIAVTPANPHIVFAQYLNPNTGNSYGLYKSCDDGITWQLINNYEISLQGGYDWVLAVSPKDTNTVLYGGQYIYGSSNGGKTQINKTSGHVDHHDLAYRPGTSVLYNCNDGGIYKSYDNGSSWLNLNKGLQTFQFYRLGSSQTNENAIITGAQDNGTQKHNATAWYQFGQLADGMECIFDFSDNNIFYTANQYGYLTRYGAGTGFKFPPTAGDSRYCAWVTPYLIHPTNPKILYFGAKDVYKTTDRGNSWVNYSSQLTADDGVGGGMLRWMAISESNPENYLYAASYVVVYKTSDGGKNWSNITSNLPTSAGCYDCSAISSVTVHPLNPNIVWVTMSGFSAPNKVFESTDGGVVWNNITENLPNIPINCMVYQKDSKDILYIGTDLGIFYKYNTDKNWKPFMKGLPSVPVSEMEIQYASGKLRAATFGRGLWESNVWGAISGVETEAEKNQKWLYPNPASSYITFPESLTFSNAPITIYSSLGTVVYQGNATKKMDVSHLTSGIYFVKSGDRILKFVKK